MKCIFYLKCSIRRMIYSCCKGIVQCCQLGQIKKKFGNLDFWCSLSKFGEFRQSWQHCVSISRYFLKKSLTVFWVWNGYSFSEKRLVKSEQKIKSDVLWYFYKKIAITKFCSILQKQYRLILIMFAQRGLLACSKTAKRYYCFCETANIINFAGT